MPLDPNIILQAQAPKQIDPISSIGGLMQLRGQMADIALRQQQVEQSKQLAAQEAQTTEENRAKQVQANRDLADQNTLQALEKDHEAYADIHSGDPVKIGKRLGGIVQPKTLSAVQDYTNKQIEQQATLHTTELNQRKEASEQVGQTIDGLIRMVEEDGGKVDRANQNFVSAKAALGPELAALKVDPSQLPNSVNSVDDLYRFLAQTKALGSQATAAIARKGEQAKAQQAEAAAASSQATADLNNFKLNLLKGGSDPVTLAASVDKLIDPVKFPQANADAKAAAAVAAKSGDPAKITDAIQGIYNEQIGKAAGANSLIQSEVAKQKALLPGEVQKAVETETATAPAKVAEQVAAGKALRAGDNPAYSGVAPAAIPTVQNAAIKADSDYATAKQAADEMSTMTSLARGGNKVAYAYAPTTGVLTINSANGSKRVNLNEIESYAGAGSDIDKIKAFFGKHTEGKSIDADILNAMDQTHQALLGTQYDKYTGTLNSLNQRTGAKLQPTYEPPSTGAKSIPDPVKKVLAGASPGVHTLSDGTKWMKAADGTITEQAK